MLLVLQTGCRPSEAAYLVLEQSFKRTRAHEGCDYLAVVPAQYTKTRERYKWALKREANETVELVMALHERPPSLHLLGTQAQLADKLHNWFKRRILPDAAKTSQAVDDALKSQFKYNLRTVRARFAEDWADAVKEAEALGKQVPPNPLQHRTARTTFRHYVPPAGSDADDDSDDDDSASVLEEAADRSPS